MVYAADYPGAKPVVLLPTGRLLRFPSVAKAKVYLTEKHYWRIIPDEAFFHAARFSDEHAVEFKSALRNISGKGTELTWDNLVKAAEIFDPWNLSEDIHHEEGKVRKLTSRVTNAGMKIKVDAKDYTKAYKTWPKQLKIIADELVATFNDDKWFFDEDVVRLLDKIVGKGLLKTKQPPIRVFKFYRKRLLDCGLIILRADQ